MSGNSARLAAIEAIANLEPVESSFDYKNVPTQEIWADNVFSIKKMAERLPKSAFKSLKKTIASGAGRVSLLFCTQYNRPHR